jgi:hypothetical protein
LAGGTNPTTAAEGDNHTVTFLEVLNILTNCHDLSHGFMPGHMRQLNSRVMPLPSMPITAANSIGEKLNNDPIISWCGVRYSLSCQITTERLKNDCFHVIFLFIQAIFASWVFL